MSGTPVGRRGGRIARRIGAGLAALVGAIALVMPAATIAAAAPVSVEPELSIGAPWSQSLYGRWEPDESAPLPSTTRHLSVVVPRALFDFEAPLSARLSGAQRTPMAIASADATSRTITVDIPEGYFSSAEGQPGMGTGSPRYSLVIETSRPLPEPITVPPGYQADNYTSNGRLSIGFAAGGPGASDHSRVVEAGSAQQYTSTADYWIDPASETQVVPGGIIQLGGGLPLDEATASVTGDWATDSSGPLTVPAAMQIAPGAIDVIVPAESQLSSFFNRHVTLAIAGTSERTSVTIHSAFTIVHEASSGPGVTTRIGGIDRYAGATAYSRALLPRVAAPPGTTVMLATGEKFPDALSGAAAAAHIGGSLLLMRPDPQGAPLTSLDTAAEAQRLRATDIWTIGGPASVSYSASLDVAGIAGTTGPWRVDGQDRYEVSRKVADQFFPEGASTVFIATGLTFPDALAAVPAAAAQDAPVLLVPGTNGDVDQSTLATLSKLGVEHVVIVGGPAAVSPGIEARLKSLHPGAVERISGADRFEVAAAVATRFFPTTDEAFVATGVNFPDALTGGVLAASRHAPLLLVRQDCIPAAAHAALTGWAVSTTTLLGGPAILGTGVTDLVPC